MTTEPPSETDHPGREPDDDRLLLARMRRGDRDALGLLYERHVRPVYWQAYRVVGVDADAEEVVQDVFVTAWRRRDDIHVVDRSVLPWLLATAKYTALNHQRRRRRRAWAELDENVASIHPGPDDVVVADLVLERVHEHVRSLSTLDQRLFSLCVAGDRSYAEAADELGVTHGTVRNRVSRIRSRVRTATEDLRGPA
ncbi:RNA polymerase sigma factor [Mumia flava]|nr:RNA polymerase sigma factor [Mumia flava]